MFSLSSPPACRFPLFALFAFAAIACASPDTISFEEERAMGARVAQEAAAQLPLLRDPEVKEFVVQLGPRLVEQVDTTRREYNFFVVDSRVTNAFAVPGGFIFVNRGILEMADDVSEVAGVMAHEIGHVVERHSVEQMAKAQNANTAVSLIYLLLGRAPGVGEQVALQVAGSAWMAKHSRQAEREADAVGIEYMTRAEIDPRGMPRFFEKLLQQERNRPGLVIPWFSTHPLTAERVAETEAYIAQHVPREALARADRDHPAFDRVKQRLARLPLPPEPRGAAVVP